MTSFEKAQFVVGVGAQKAGTTWLYDYFKNHPDFCITHMKELHYFDVRYYADFSYDDYEKKMLRRFRDVYRINPDVFFRLCMSNDERCYKEYFKYIYKGQRAFGEITPNYAVLNSTVFSRIEGLHPGAKFIFLMRNPADRLWAQIRFHSQIYGQNIDVLCNQIDQPIFRLKSDYIRTIRELYKSVDPSHVLLLFYEDLFCDATIQKICDFCDISFLSGAYDKVSNKGRVIRTLDSQRRKEFIAKLYDVYASINDFFDRDIPESWNADMKLIEGTMQKPVTGRFDYTCNQDADRIYQKKLSENIDPNVFRKLFTIEDNNPLFHYYRSQLQFRDGAYEASVQSLQKAARLSPYVPHYSFFLSKLLRKQSRYFYALRHYGCGLFKLLASPQYIINRFLRNLYRNLPHPLRNYYSRARRRKLHL